MAARNCAGGGDRPSTEVEGQGLKFDHAVTVGIDGNRSSSMRMPPMRGTCSSSGGRANAARVTAMRWSTCLKVIDGHRSTVDAEVQLSARRQGGRYPGGIRARLTA